MSGPGAILSSSPETMKIQRSWMPSIHIPIRSTARESEYLNSARRFPRFQATYDSSSVVISLPPATAYLLTVGIDRPTSYWLSAAAGAEGKMERRLAAIVCADVAGYARMMGADEGGTHAAFKAHRGAIHPVILNHGGRIVKNTGDGFLLEFPSVVGATEAAIAIQTLMADRKNQLPADRIMHFRLGVHMGDVMADEGEIFGDDVNIAVRLESVATPGGVAVSSKAYLEASK